MAVDRTALISELSQHGTVVFCDNNSTLYYLIVVTGWNLDINSLYEITDNYLSADFPFDDIITLNNGLLKAQFSNFRLNINAPKV